MKTPPPFIVLISAEFEWNAVVDLVRPTETRSTPFGAAFFSQLGKHSLLMAHSGWGKTATAAACQHLIDLHQPQLILNLGTCGGLEGRAEVDEILLPEETAMYDIVEGMSAYSEALAYYRIRADLNWLPAKLPPGVRRTRIVSADQDIQPRNVDLIANYFHAPAADWESAAFAWTAAKIRRPGSF
jgi:Nucleoside phosphorylase